MLLAAISPTEIGSYGVSAGLLAGRFGFLADAVCDKPTWVSDCTLAYPLVVHVRRQAGPLRVVVLLLPEEVHVVGLVEGE